MIHRRYTPPELIRLVVGVSLAFFVTFTAADPDLWGHLRFGLDLLATRSIPSFDSYSFTSDRAWVNHEWLSELLLAIAYTHANAFGLNLLKVFCIVIVAAIVTIVAREEDATPSARDTLVALTVFVTYTRTQTLRPQMFSIALFCVVLFLIRQFDRGRARAIWGIPLCFALWVNLHGAWIVGLAAVGAWLAVALLESRGLRSAAPLLLAGFATVAATLVNPYGLGLWRFLVETVRPGRPDITEWAPLLTLPWPLLGVEMLLPVLGVVALAREPRRLRLRHAVVLVILIAAAVKVSRVDGFAQAAIAILMAPQMISALQAFSHRLRAPVWTTALPVGPLVALVVAGVVVVGTLRMREVAITGTWIPDRDAAAFLREHSPGTRVLTWFDWGEYAIWHLSPAGIRVSLDGRRETVYSPDVLAHHFAFYEARAADLDYPERINADVVWLPREFPVVEPLKRRGWNLAFGTARSVVLTRSPELHQAESIGSEGRPIFPWR